MKRIGLAILAALLFSQLLAVDLTQEEQAWIKDHPQIKLGIGESWAPFIFPKEDGNHEGFDVDMLKLINQITGMKIEIVPGNWSEMVQMAQNREIDGLAESAANESRKEFFDFTQSYLTQYYALATTPDKINRIRSEDDIKGKTLALIKGNAWLHNLVDTLGEVQIVETNTDVEAFSLVVEGRADASFMTLGMFSEYRKMFFENIMIAHIFNEEKYQLKLLYSIRNDWPELVSILDKALDAINQVEKIEIYKKWFGFTMDDFESQTLTQLTEEESAWLKEHPVIRIAPDPDTPPIEWFDENGGYQGITAEFINLISKGLNVKFEIVRCKTWDEVLSKAKNREVDLIPAAAQTPERAEYMLFSEPYLVFSGVIITKSEKKNLSSSKKLNGKKVGVVSGYIWHKSLTRDYPEIDIVPVDHISLGLRKVSTGEIDAFVGILPIAIHYIDKEGINNLVVAGETEFTTKISILSRKDWPLLNSIITKTLKAIPTGKKKEIINKWITLKSISLFANSTFWIITISMLVGGVLIVIIASLWNISLKKQVMLKTTELSESESKYKMLIENQVDMLVKVDLEGRLLFVSPSYCKMFNKTEDELLGKKFMPLVHEEDQKTTQEEMKKLFQPPYSCYVEQRGNTRDGWKWLSWMDSAVLDDNGQVIEIIGLGRDISKQKESELKIARIAREWQSTFDATNDAIWTLDKEHVIQRCNESSVKMFNTTYDELIGKKCWEIVHGTNEPVEDCPCERAQRTLKRETMELPSNEKWFLITVDPILDDSGKFCGAVHIIRDITHRKKIENELKKYREHLEELVKERTAELEEKNIRLEDYNKLFIGREFRIKELKEKVKELEMKK
jgi:PAS domain S-box-containing protein